MRQVGGFDDFGFVEDDADFDFAGGDHLDVDAAFAEGLEEFRCDAGMAPHADADDAEFCNAIDGGEAFGPDLGDEWFQSPLDFWEFVFVDGEGDVGRAAAGDVLHDHIDVDIRVGDGGEEAGGDAGMVGHAANGDFGLVPIDADAADDDIFHAHSFFFDEGAGVVVEAAADFEEDAKFFGEFDAARLHDFGAGRGHFEHFVVADLGDFLRAGNDARVGGVNAIDVGENLAEVGLGGGGEGDRGEVGAAASEGGDAAVDRFALEPGDDTDVTRI